MLGGVEFLDLVDVGCWRRGGSCEWAMQAKVEDAGGLQPQLVFTQLCDSRRRANAMRNSACAISHRDAFQVRSIHT